MVSSDAGCSALGGFAAHFESELFWHGARAFQVPVRRIVWIIPCSFHSVLLPVPLLANFPYVASCWIDPYLFQSALLSVPWVLQRSPECNSRQLRYQSMSPLAIFMAFTHMHARTHTRIHTHTHTHRWHSRYVRDTRRAVGLDGFKMSHDMMMVGEGHENTGPKFADVVGLGGCE